MKPSQKKSKKTDLQEYLPESVNIFGRDIKVKITNLKGTHGDFDADLGEIRIHQNSTKENANNTLFHECIHAALYISGQKELLSADQEEALVRAIEHGLAHLVDFNKIKLDKPV